MCPEDDSPALSAPRQGVAGATLCINLRSLQANYRKLSAMAGSAQCAAAVKANAYGLGLVPVVKALAGAGCRTFFVALPEEGLAVRRVLDDATIYILNGLMPGSARDLIAHRLRPVLNSLLEVADWAAACRADGRRLPAALHIDTGINRLGLTEPEVRTLSQCPKDLQEVRVELIMSHLACGDCPNHEMNAEQLAAFDRLRAFLPPAPASIANSAGVQIGPRFHHDLVRPGIALYGGNAFADRANVMRPVAHVYGVILQVRDLQSGDSVGYGATWTAERQSRIAVVGAGYADGIFRRLSGSFQAEHAHVFIGGQFAPIVGRVSMDMITVDVTEVSPDFARRGAKVEIMGDHVTVDDVARWAGTIPYEILTGLGSRYARLYSDFDSCGEIEEGPS